EAEHPELVDHLRSEADEVVVDGRPMSPRLHLAMHEVVASQLWEDDPPEAWLAAERLAAAGYDRHEVLHMLGSVTAGELWRMSRLQVPFDRDRYVAGLEALPGSWERERGHDDDDEHDSYDYDDHGCGDPECRSFHIRLPQRTTLTHRLTAAEVAGDFVTVEPDLEPLEPFLDEGDLPLLGGEVAESDVLNEAGEVLVGPPGWLAGAGAGDLVGFRVAGDEVEVVRVREPDTPEELGESLRRVFDRENDGDGMPVTVVELVHGVAAELVEAGEVTAESLVLPPVGELLAQNGFEVRDGFAAPAGADWEGFGRIRLATGVAAAQGLDLEEARFLVMLCELYRLFAEGKPVFDACLSDIFHEIAQRLADPPIGEAFVGLALVGPHRDHLDRFFDAITASGDRRLADGLAWIRAVVARRLGDHERAERLLRQALVADPEHWEALEDGAWYASDRGDARLAVRLLDRLARLGDDEAEHRAAVLRPHASPRAAEASRNDPCPCGSGQKYKRCCLGKVGLAPLPDRVRWIWEKLDWFVSRSTLHEEVDDVVGALGGYEPSDLLMATSLVLFQDGAVEEFLTDRGKLLPPDEWNLVSQWALVDRSVHEVVALQPGAGMTLRDVRTGDVMEVRERTGSTQVAVGDLLFAHVVPDGIGYQIVGGIITIPLRLRDPLIAALDGDAEGADIAELIARAWAPPEVVTMEGEPMVMCEARYRISDPAAVASLDALLDRDDHMTWSESTEVDGRRWVRGTVSVQQRELVVTANSEVRFSRLREVVEAAIRGLELAAVETTPASEVMSHRPGRAPTPPTNPLPPQAAVALAEFMREQEQRWVDESIPALGGLTPRQAATDPTRREQLIALLHDFDRNPLPPGAASFDTGRLRRTLGLNR
ncbi:MAG: DUF1841 family protein, partial [Actinomycetota bacterium]|nr:DUF1841 family protein [Actinomycetota bacterium]